VSPAPVTNPLPAAPHAALRARVLEIAGRLEAAGADEAARELRGALETWWTELQAWTGELARELAVHHEINNALVGVRGNVQLLQMGPAAQTSGVRDRLEVVLRESDRIRQAAARLNALKAALASVAREADSAPSSRAA